jgi:transaldolase
VKDPAYPDTMYVAELIAPDLVNTMPEATLNAVADDGVIREDTIRGNYTDAQQVLDDLAAVGIDYHDVVTLLEEEGVGKFEASWALVADQLTERLRAAQATQLSRSSLHTLTVNQEATTHGE